MRRFNEAAGIHRRKRVTAGTVNARESCFNEAAGIHRRKRRRVRRQSTRLAARFNEAAGIHRRKPVLQAATTVKIRLLQ